MQLRWVKIFPYFLSYTDDISEGSAGVASGVIVKIRPAYKDDIGIEMHEAQHILQFWRTLGFHVFLKAFSWYMLRCEVEAYREQLKHPPAEGKDEYRRLYAEFISTKYGLNVTEEKAYELLG